MNKLKLGCIADDFTGGSDAASFLKKGGLRVILINGNEYSSYAPGSEEAIVIALKTRSVDAKEAVSQSLAAARWLLGHGARQLYFKYCSTFDSTAEGNIGPVTDALMELVDTPFTLLCPALPINGRTVKDGVLYVNGVPLSESPMRYHPLNPMLESSIELLMGRQSRYPCVTLRDAVFSEGGESVSQRLTESARRFGHITAVPDYYRPEHGAGLAEAFGGLPLLTGGSGLLEHLARRVRDRDTQQPESAGPEARGRRLILCGSCSSMTQKQVKAYLDAGKRAIRVEPAALLAGSQTEDGLMRAVRSAQDDLLLYSTAGKNELVVSAGGVDIPALLERLMGELAACGEAAGVRRIIVAGGETSGAVTRRLGHALFRIGGDAAPGVPVMIPLDSPDMRLVLKSGNFGDEDFFLKTLA